MKSGRPSGTFTLRAFGENVTVFDPFRQPGPLEIFQDCLGVFPEKGQPAPELGDGDASPAQTNTSARERPAEVSRGGGETNLAPGHPEE